MTQHPFTLHEDDDAKVVQLSGSYYTSWGGSVNELKAMFYQTGHIELYRFKSEDGSTSEGTRFALSSEEAAAFASAYETFKAAQEIKRQAEEKRVADVVQQVRELIAGTPIVLEEHPATENNTLYWTFRYSEMDISYYAQNTDALLKHANDIKAVYERHQAGKAPIDEAFALVEACPAITINGNKGATAWCVVMQNPGFRQWVHSGKELLETVQAAKAKYDRWQADQAIIQQEDNKWRSL